MGEGVRPAGEISDGENGWRREGWGGTNGPKTQLAADTQGQRQRGRQKRVRAIEALGGVKRIKIEGVESEREASRHRERQGRDSYFLVMPFASVWLR